MKLRERRWCQVLDSSKSTVSAKQPNQQKLMMRTHTRESIMWVPNCHQQTDQLVGRMQQLPAIAA
jgi:hypothetical protein